MAPAGAGQALCEGALRWPDHLATTQRAPAAGRARARGSTPTRPIRSFRGRRGGARRAGPRACRLQCRERRLPAGLCAPRPRRSRAHGAGRRPARAGAAGGGRRAERPVTPCGGCRQKLREFAADDSPCWWPTWQGVRARFTLERVAAAQLRPRTSDMHAMSTDAVAGSASALRAPGARGRASPCCWARAGAALTRQLCRTPCDCPTRELPAFPAPASAGHAGELWLGRLGGARGGGAQRPPARLRGRRAPTA